MYGWDFGDPGYDLLGFDNFEIVDQIKLVRVLVSQLHVQSST